MYDPPMAFQVAPGAEHLPRAMEPRLYVEASVFEREKEAVFARSWQFACHESQVAEAGDYLAFSVADEPLFCVRAGDGTVKTFYNVCAHRAHELVAGTGSKKLLVCPYHAWSYDLDGALRKAPGSDGVPGFDASAICLTEVRTELFCGFVFVNLDPDAASMDETYPGAREQLAEFLPAVGRMRPIERVDFVAGSNWKVAVENYNECYHCKVVHPSFSAGVVKPSSYNVIPNGAWFRHVAESAEASPHQDGYSSFYLWPTFSFQVYPGKLLNTFCWRPATHDRTPFSREWFSVDGADDPEVHEMAALDAKTTVAEDLDLVASVQRGLASRGYRPGPLVVNPGEGVLSEHSVLAFKQLVLEALGEADDRP